MPIAKSLGKVQKQKGGTKLHPKGRKIKQLTRAQLRQDKLQTNKSMRSDAQSQKLLRLHFFKSFIEKIEQESYTIPEIHDMIVAYIERNSDELDQLKSQRRPGRPSSSRQDSLQMQLEYDDREYNDGFTLPDLRDPQVVKALKAWKGSVGGTNTLVSIRIARDASEPC
ncbi:Translation machinery-associated protein 16 [Wickerhamiella sorbophila]|uniref:Translation machinery-associated protein 16 n=1 Tax=Wickerhamiella sorbophila TaxID=45607 RepID=A0A2T0FGW0_9ASCO|nr:Translation machinery-associated protein 16 [Wickerhamiella sorbophila]PRT54224.1 Translation machinery-associated protein 16 [Wickerhamiella sorbophila]